MAFDNEGWTRRLKQAKSTEEITAMIMELPDGPLPDTKKETEGDGREFYLLQGRTPIRCYGERDVYFYVPFYEKVGNDCINGIQVTTMFLGIDHGCFERQTH